jgi:hypothetical protein
MMPLAPVGDIKCPWCPNLLSKGKYQVCDDKENNHVKDGGLLIILNDEETHISEVWFNCKEGNLFFKYERNRLEYAKGRHDDTMIFRKIGLPFEINFSSFKTPELVADFFRMIKVFI